MKEHIMRDNQLDLTLNNENNINTMQNQQSTAIAGTCMSTAEAKIYWNPEIGGYQFTPYVVHNELKEIHDEIDTIAQEKYQQLLLSYGDLSFNINNMSEQLRIAEQNLLEIHNTLLEFKKENPGIE